MIATAIRPKYGADCPWRLNVKKDSWLRATAKDIAPLYWLVGLFHYMKFRSDLHRENRIHRAQSSPNSPPPILRYRVHRAFDEASYLHNGQAIARCLVEALDANGVRLEGLAVLDFACGPGRVTHALHAYTQACALYGSDIDAQAIDWARTHLSDKACFSTNTIAAPTGFTSGMFDVIYCVSLFTHLDEPAQDEWLGEMARMLKPAGVLVTTTHGRFAVDSCTAAERSDLLRDGIVFRVDRKGRFKVDGLPDFYQTTFHTVDYVKTHWSRFLPVVDVVEGGLNGHQDIVVMRKPRHDEAPRASGS
jgi:2-polyprenyl-3-methyl-5-hydroxy-6-metoxy-1,4-benzoquinol methylase